MQGQMGKIGKEHICHGEGRCEPPLVAFRAKSEREEVTEGDEAWADGRSDQRSAYAVGFAIVTCRRDATRGANEKRCSLK